MSVLKYKMAVIKRLIIITLVSYAIDQRTNLIINTYTDNDQVFISFARQRVKTKL